MIRKTILGFAAVGALAAAALAPTSASAWGFHHGWGHHGFGWGFYGPGYVSYAPDCYLVKRYNSHGKPYLVRVCS